MLPNQFFCFKRFFKNSDLKQAMLQKETFFKMSL